MYHVLANENDGQGWFVEAEFDYKSEAEDYIRRQWYAMAADREMGLYEDIDYKIKEVA